MHYIRLLSNKISSCGVVISKIEPPFIAISNLFILIYSIRPSGNGLQIGVASFNINLSYSVILGILPL
jgi:hypothetical protein